MKKELLVCSRCVMDSTVLDIKFDESGVCNFCKYYNDILVQDLFSDKDGEERLSSLVNKIKKTGKNKQYDCLIGLSGGVDSSYVAYLIKKKFGLRALAIHLDNGWNTELAVSNIENIVKKLDIDLQTYVLDWKEFKDIQTSFIKSSISNIEIPTDHAIWAVLIKTASKLGIKYIIAGNNVVTESIMPESWLYGSKDSKLIESIHSRFGKVKMNSYPRLKSSDYVKYLLLQGIRWVPILNYVPYVKNDAKQILINELDWRDYGAKHYESIFTRFFHAYYLPNKFGYDLRKSYLSALICSGQIDRKTALEEISKPTAPKELLLQDKEYVIKKLGLTNEEFDIIMASDNKTFADYPNNNLLWKRFNWIIQHARTRITRVS